MEAMLKRLSLRVKVEVVNGAGIAAGAHHDTHIPAILRQCLHHLATKKSAGPHYQSPGHTRSDYSSSDTPRHTPKGDSSLNIDGGTALYEDRSGQNS